MTIALDALPSPPLLRVFVPGRLPLGLNARKHWRQTYAERSEIIERVTVYVRNALRERGVELPVMVDPKRPKLVTFEVCLPRRRDCDTPQGATKYMRDALVKLGLIHSDSIRSGHRFIYMPQRIAPEPDTWITIEEFPRDDSST